ncbi:TrmH family RNA methyltransferase [bacterium]|nr:TrmH family RNA methyltransferase [bacterium]
MMETKLDVLSYDSALDPEAFKAVRRRPVRVILEDLRSAFNVGSIIRTADCALVERVTACGITAHPPHKKLTKTSLGALDYVPVDYMPSAVAAVQAAKKDGYAVVALELTNRSVSIWEYAFQLPAALVMGNEALGISHEVLREADAIVEIPMLGFKNSLNVATAFGIAVYEMQRQHLDRFPCSNRLTNIKMLATEP